MKATDEITKAWEQLRSARLAIEEIENCLREQPSVSAGELRAKIKAIIQTLEAARKGIKIQK